MRLSGRSLRGVQSLTPGQYEQFQRPALERGPRMKTFALVACVAVCLGFSAARGADEKLDLSGTYTLVSGKKNGADVDEKAKKATYTATADTFTIAGGDVKM